MVSGVRDKVAKGNQVVDDDSGAQVGRDRLVVSRGLANWTSESAGTEVAQVRTTLVPVNDCCATAVMIGPRFCGGVTTMVMSWLVESWPSLAVSRKR